MEGLRERLLRRGDYIWGSFVKPEQVDGYIVGINPGDRSDSLGRFPFSEASVEDAVDAAVRGTVQWRRVARVDRAKAVRRFRDSLNRYQEKIAILISRETGKPLWESRQEVTAAIRAVDLLIEEGLALLQPRILNEREARSDYRPRGVVGILAPSNLPLLLPALQTAAALLAGNTCVVKPSKFTPGVGQVVAEMWDRCRLPRGVFNLVQGSGASVGQKLAVHPRIDALLFSGSFQTAMALRRATYERPELPTSYQCGGKGAAMVIDGCDLDRALYEVLVGAYLTAGQRHNSTGRVIVTEPIFESFLKEFTARTKRLNVGSAFDGNSFMGPVISENYRTRFRRYGHALESRGHRVLLPAVNREVAGFRGYYASPSVFVVDWQNGHAFLNDEPPGPTLLFYRVPGWEEAVALHNKLQYRLSTALFIRPDHPALGEIVGRLKSGSLNVNRGTIGSSMRLPSVGLGRSANGVPGGIDLLRFLATPRSTLVETRPFDPTQAVPGVNWPHGVSAEEVEVEVDPL